MFIEIELISESKNYWSNKMCHIRENKYGPAYISLINSKIHFKVYIVEGKFHNELGPAMFLRAGDKFYYLNGIHMTYNKWLELRKENNVYHNI